ncbi:MAG TPA: hypothetical protein P5079_11060, partial [Elusimicrobiota bacterium]|nr:hypothetical protein [Elusimicrobiota bacterium]
KADFTVNYGLDLLAQKLFAVANREQVPEVYAEFRSAWEKTPGVRKSLGALDCLPVLLTGTQGDRYLVALVAGPEGRVPVVYREGQDGVYKQGNDAVRELLFSTRWTNKAWEMQLAHRQFAEWGLTDEKPFFHPRRLIEGVQGTLAAQQFVEKVLEEKPFVRNPAAAEQEALTSSLAALENADAATRARGVAELTRFLTGPNPDLSTLKSLVAVLENDSPAVAEVRQILQTAGEPAIPLLTALMGNAQKSAAARARAAETITPILRTLRGRQSYARFQKTLSTNKVLEALSVSESEKRSEMAAALAELRTVLPGKAERARLVAAKTLWVAGGAITLVAVIAGKASPLSLAALGIAFAAQRLFPKNTLLQRVLPLAFVLVSAAALGGLLHVLPFLALSLITYQAMRWMRRAPRWARLAFLVPALFLVSSGSAAAAELVKDGQAWLLGGQKFDWISFRAQADLKQAGLINTDTSAADAQRLIAERVDEYTELMRAKVDPNWNPNNVHEGDIVLRPPLGETVPEAEVTVTPVSETPAVVRESSPQTESTAVREEASLAPQADSALSAVSDVLLPALLVLAAVSVLVFFLYRAYRRRLNQLADPISFSRYLFRDLPGRLWAKVRPAEQAAETVEEAKTAETASSLSLQPTPPAPTDVEAPVEKEAPAPGTQMELFRPEELPPATPVAAPKPADVKTAAADKSKKGAEAVQLLLDFEQQQQQQTAAGPKAEEKTLTAVNINELSIEQLAALLKEAGVRLPYSRVATNIFNHVRSKGPLLSAEALIDAHLGIGQKSWERLAKYFILTAPEKPAEPAADQAAPAKSIGPDTTVPSQDEPTPASLVDNLAETAQDVARDVLPDVLERPLRTVTDAVLPSADETSAAEEPAAEEPTPPQKMDQAAEPLDINKASVEQLAALLKKTGAVIAYNKVAERIAARIKEKGPLGSAQELLDAHVGVGQKAWEKLAQSLTFGKEGTGGEAADQEPADTDRAEEPSPIEGMARAAKETVDGFMPTLPQTAPAEATAEEKPSSEQSATKTTKTRKPKTTKKDAPAAVSESSPIAAEMPV